MRMKKLLGYVIAFVAGVMTSATVKPMINKVLGKNEGANETPSAE